MDNQFPRPYSPGGQPPQQYNAASTAPPAQPAPYKAPKKRGGFFKFLLILILIAAVGGGIYYWQNQKVSDANKKLADANSQADSISAQFASYKNQVGDQTTAAQPATLSIKELGLQLNVPGSFKDLTYKVVDVNYKKPTNTLATYPTVFLSTKEFDALESGKCAVAASKADSLPPLGYLTKTTGQYPKTPTVDNSTGTLVKQFATYYIAYRPPASGCFADAKNNDAAKALRDQLIILLNPVVEKQ